jgi:hypothetical protein
MNDADFPVAKVMHGTMPPSAPASVRSGKHGREALHQRRRIMPDGDVIPRQQVVLRFIESMDFGAAGWRMDEVMPRRG